MKKLELSWEILKNSPGAILEGIILGSLPLGILSAASGGIAYLLKAPEVGKYLEYAALGGMGISLTGGLFLGVTGGLDSETSPLENIFYAVKSYREERNSKKKNSKNK